MIAEEYLGRSPLFRRLKSATDSLSSSTSGSRQGRARWPRHVAMPELGRRSLQLDQKMRLQLISMSAPPEALCGEAMHPAGQLREAEAIAIGVARGGHDCTCATAAEDQIFEGFSDYLRQERGLAPRSIIRHLPFVRRFLREICPTGASDLGKIRRVTRYIVCHARDRSAPYAKAMCWSLREFLRYLDHKGLTPLALADCVPSIRRWKLLPTYLSAAQVQKVLDGCDRATMMGRRDYAILMILAKLGLRAARLTGSRGRDPHPG